MLLPIACKGRSGSAPLPTHSTPAASQPPETSLGDNGLGYWRPWARWRFERLELESSSSLWQVFSWIWQKGKGKQTRRDRCPEPTDPHTGDCILKQKEKKKLEPRWNKQTKTYWRHANWRQAGHSQGTKMVAVTQELRKAGFPWLLWSNPCLCVKEGSRGPWHGSQHHGHKSKLSATGSSRQSRRGVENTRKNSLYASLFLKQKSNGLGTQIIEKWLQTKQKC